MKEADMRITPEHITMADTTKRAGRPTPNLKIEITPEMIEAGFLVLSFRYDPDASEKDRRVVVRDIYKAMTEVKFEDGVGSN